MPATALRGRYNAYDLLEIISKALIMATDTSKMVGVPYPVKQVRMEEGALVVDTDDGRTFIVSQDCITY